MYLAHSKNDVGKRHNLYSHLVSTAKRAKTFLYDVRLANFVFYAVVLHDLGKIHPDFQ